VASCGDPPISLVYFAAGELFEVRRHDGRTHREGATTALSDSIGGMPFVSGPGQNGQGLDPVVQEPAGANACRTRVLPEAAE
jgi:hypothetical protein